MKGTPSSSLPACLLYTDVAMTGQNIGRGAFAGVAVTEAGYPMFEFAHPLPRPWSTNRAELYAVMMGLLELKSRLRHPERCHVKAYTDNKVALGYLKKRHNNVPGLVTLREQALSAAASFGGVQWLRAPREHKGIRRADQLAWKYMRGQGHTSSRRAIKAKATPAKRRQAEANDPFALGPKRPRKASRGQIRRAFFRDLALKGRGIQNPAQKKS